MTAVNVLDVTRGHESTAANTFSLVDDPPVVVRAEGATLFDAAGREYVDLVCGSAVSNYGHGVLWQREAIEAVLQSGYLHTGTRLPSPFRADFYACLSEILPRTLTHFQLANSGSEAVEAALKVAQYATGRSGVISFFGGYHGRTMGALATTASAKARRGFDARPFNVHFFPYPYTARSPFPSAPGEELGSACLEFLRRALENPASGVVGVSALIVEAVQGVSGVVVPPKGFIKGLRDICTEFGILMIVDEIWNGFGRTGQWFAFERDDVVPDLVAFGKAASASLPLSGVAGSVDLLGQWPPGSHTSTFQGNPLSCAVAAENIRQAKKLNLIERCREWVEPALRDIGEAASDVRGVGEFRVAGAQLGIELQTDSGAPDKERVAAVQRAALRAGALVYGGGWYSNVLMLVPPLTISAGEMSRAKEAVMRALEETA